MWRSVSTIVRQPAITAISSVCLALLVVVGSGQGWAQAVVAPGDALAMARAGQITIIDIRRPDEWRDTGIATGAKRATVHFSRGAAKFLNRIAKLTGGDKSQPIALICAAGVRSKHASRLLKNKGYTQVLDISEGMLGNHRGAGWLRRDLPVRPCEDCP
jgi:rhodanese-related sulfurtransferase